MQSESSLKMFSASSEDYRDTLSWRLKHAPPQDKWIYEFGLKFKMCEYDFKYLQNSLAKEREEDEDIAAARKRGEDEIGLNFLRARRILKQWEENNEREFWECVRRHKARALSWIPGSTEFVKAKEE